MIQPAFVSNSSPWIAFEPSWVNERPLTQSVAALALTTRLGAGEREAIALALELGPCYLLLDDLAARRSVFYS